MTIDGDPACSYNIGAYAEGEIVATPSNIEKTRDAWAELTDHISTDTPASDDSYILIANGSYAHIDDEKLVFEDDVDEELVLDNFSILSDLEDTVRGSVTVIEADEYAV